MVWFHCEDCGDSLKKPKLAAHLCRCSASKLTCLDCSTSFNQKGAQSHTSCVTEHEKYALGVTKLGFINQIAKPSDTDAPAALAFLADRPPWQCRLCNVTCTSRDTLLGHATGAKHVRRVKARQKQGQKEAQVKAGEEGVRAIEAKEGVPVDDSNLLKRRQTDAAAEPTEAALSGQPESGALKRQKVRESAKIREGTSTQPTEAEASALAAAGNVKWKKLAAAELKLSGSLSLQKLRARVCKAASLPLSPALKRGFRRKLESSSQFVIENGVVSLRE